MINQQTNTIKSYNPATGEMIGEVPVTGQREVKDAIDSAKKAFPEWSTLSFKARAAYLQKATSIIIRDSDEIAELITRETGKPKAESMATEVFVVLEEIKYWTHGTEKMLREENVKHGFIQKDIKSKIAFEPLGVIGAILPWNFPFSSCFTSLIPALMSGNTVILKPSEYAPFCALKAANILKESGIPENVITILTGDGSTGRLLVESDVDRICFTGSVGTGKRIIQGSNNSFHPVTLELGGKDPAIICEDADLERASNGVVWGAFMNAGQTCASVERVYVVEETAERFIRKVVEKTKRLRVGNGLDPDIDIGPLANRKQLDTVLSHVEDAVNKGAEILTGGEQMEELSDLFYAPTILINVNHDMLIITEETFGPVLPIMVVKNTEEAISLSNDSKFGLASSVWTQDIANGERIARKIKAGTCWINHLLHIGPRTPWGGTKESGIGRAGSRYGLLDFVSIKHVSIDFSKKPNMWWWYPYNISQLGLFRGIFKMFFADNIMDKLKGFRGIWQSRKKG